jgi:TRAP-type C4-dicarboxylate transport system substrate-binding protein
MRLWVRPGDADEIAAWQAAGFRVVPLPATDVLPSLNSGMIEACAVSPLAAVSMQWFALAPNMCDMRVSPLIGALIMSTRSIRRIHADLRSEIVEASREVTDRLGEEVDSLDEEALRIMQENGLVVNSVPEAARRAWHAVMDESFYALVGKSFSRESYELVRRYVDEYRSGNHNAW